MRSVGFPRQNNKNVTRRIIVISAFLLSSACSPLSSRLDEYAGSNDVYPLADSFVTNSISPRSRSSYVPSRRVTSRSLAPIDEYSPVETVKTSYRQPDNGVVVVRSGDTLLGVAREHDVDAVDLAELNALDAPYGLKVGDELVLPGTQAANKIAAKRATQTRRVARTVTKTKPKKIRTVAIPAVKAKKTRVAKTVTPRKKIALKQLKKTPAKKPVKIASVEKPLVKKKPAAKPSSVKRLTTKRQASLGNKFRWPVRGRVISEFGSKSNGAKNDGINLSVPKGAAIVAAENGVVVYSGNELKGYGNLVLIRHKDGWSTAYAHVSQMLVKKGQKVRRGQVIAKAGQTGSVSRPQLHFELRRGTNPVNPRKYLSGTKVALR